jgi:hypothetical protein
MDKQGWYSVHKQVLPKPVLGGAPQIVELHLFDKSGLSEGQSATRAEVKKDEKKDLDDKDTESED